MNTEISKKSSSDLIEHQVDSIIPFLEELGLPADNIIAQKPERKIIADNLLVYINSLPENLKKDARYLSKFVVGAGFGLFDYALNSIWNEVTITLRKKAINYGIDIFFDAAVGGSMRPAFQKEEDLAGLKDKILLDTCRKLELISDITYKKLAHILDMRNDIGISHPTNYVINAFELLGWLQTCIQDVIKDQPSEAAIKVKSFIDNLKTLTTLLSPSDIGQIGTQINSLASHHCDNILRTLFGLYTADSSDPVLLKNISSIAPIVWQASKDEMKYKLGVTLEGYNNNLNKKKYEKGVEFFTFCSGNKYRTNSEKIINLENLADSLKNVHYAWDNFYNEVPVIQKILTYFDNTSDIPPQVAPNLIKSILFCRVGNGVRYNKGISPGGKEYYDAFFKLIGQDHLPALIVLLTNFDVQQRLSINQCREQCVEILTMIRENTVNERYAEALDFLIKNLHKSEKIVFDTEFKKITSTFLKWS